MLTLLFDPNFCAPACLPDVHRPQKPLLWSQDEFTTTLARGVERARGASELGKPLVTYGLPRGLPSMLLSLAISIYLFVHLSVSLSLCRCERHPLDVRSMSRGLSQQITSLSNVKIPRCRCISITRASSLPSLWFGAMLLRRYPGSTSTTGDDAGRRRRE